MNNPGNHFHPAQNQQSIWDQEYKKKGRLWRNIPLEPTAQKDEGIFLDLGCGDGKNLRRTKPNDSLKIGLDFSLEALSLCRKCPELHNVSYVCSSVTHLPFQDNSVQYADAHHVLGHLLEDDRKRAVHEISRILVPGGLLQVTVFAEDDFRNGTGIKAESGTYMKGTGIITHYFSSEELNRLFSSLVICSQEMSSWIMKIKGRDYIRAQWIVCCKKSSHISSV